MQFVVSTTQFQGPLDLMYHLIKENKLDLFDLNMDVLTDQYLAYLNAMEEMHLEVASEFLVELAGLLEYKSRKLLPKEKVEIEEEYEENHRDKLVKRLLEYQRYKEVSASLNELYEQRSLSYTKPLSEETKAWVSQVKEEEFKGNPYDLIKAMNKVLRRVALNTPMKTQLAVKEMSVDERTTQIRLRLSSSEGKVSFTDLCMENPTKHFLIITFLSILDLINTGFIHYSIDDENEIWIMKGDLYD